MIKIKRIYNAPSNDDGERFLLERLWLRGLTQEAAAFVEGWTNDDTR